MLVETGQLVVGGFSRVAWHDRAVFGTPGRICGVVWCRDWIVGESGRYREIVLDVLGLIRCMMMNGLSFVRLDSL